DGLSNGVHRDKPRHFRGSDMDLFNTVRRRHVGGMLAAAVAAVLAAGAAAGQTAIKFSLDFKFEGPAAPFVVAIDKGYFKAEGLHVTIATPGGSLEPSNRVAPGRS